MSAFAFDSALSLRSRTIPADAGRSRATAIDLTSGDEEEVQLRQTRVTALDNVPVVVFDDEDIRSARLGTRSAALRTSLNAATLNGRISKRQLAEISGPQTKHSGSKAKDSVRLARGSGRPGRGSGALSRDSGPLARGCVLLARGSGRQEKDSGPDLEILLSHRTLSFWKDKYFEELGMATELELVNNAAQFWNITTVVPNRYLKFPSGPKTGNKTLNFSIPVEILTVGNAVKQAYAEHTAARQDVTRLVLWTDGSARQSSRGFAVAWRRSTIHGWGAWEGAGYKAIGELLDSGSMESLAVIKALDNSVELIRKQPGKFKTIAIYTDSTHAIHCAKSSKTSIGRHLQKKAQLVQQLGARLSIHWCPGHSKIPGNELADKIAGRACTHQYNDMPEMVDLSDDD